MKIILSRKGFDSEYGGYPSIILPSGEMINLPIPCSEDKERYIDLNTLSGINAFEIMSQVNRYIKYREKIILDANTTCHLDPDLVYGYKERKDGWRGCLGQIGAAQKVLENNNVKEGDLFIFFGWFNDCEETESGYKFKKGNDRHTMFGYLQIDKIIYPSKEVVPEYLKDYCHAKGYRRLNNDSNCIYIAKETCSFNKNIKGYGMFKYSDDLDLTKKGYTRTKWNLPDIFRDVSITYHSKNSFKDEYFQSACRGQEFVIEENKDIEKWAIDLIEKHAIREVQEVS